MTVSEPIQAAPETTSQGDAESLEVEPVDAELVEDDVLVEEISIDGMCGVY